jgi:hypothetical protein
MSVASGPKIVTDGLLFGYDMYDPQSYRGAAVSNQFAVPTPDGSNNVAFQVQGTGTFQRTYSGTFDNYSITNNDVVYRYDLVAAGGCYYHGNDVSITAGQWATFTFDYYISPGAGGYPVTNYLANFESAVSNSAADPTPTVTGVWKTATFTAQAGSTGTCRMLLYPGACNGTSLATSGFILYRNPQVLISSSSNFTAPFVGPFGSRSSTNALLDVTGSRTITINSLTYASNNTFSFNGSTDFLTIPTISLGNGNLPWTVSAWVKTTTDATGLGQGSILSNLSGGPVYSALCVNSGKIAYWTYQNSAWAQKLGVGTTVNDNNWHLLTWVNNSNSTMAMYVDGVLDSNVANSTSGNNNPVDTIGNSWNAKFAGSIPAIQVYNVALTAEQVALNFAAFRGKYGV